MNFFSARRRCYVDCGCVDRCHVESLSRKKFSILLCHLSCLVVPSLLFRRQTPLVDVGLAATDAPSSAAKKGKKSMFGLRRPSFLKKGKSSSSEVRESMRRGLNLGGNVIVNILGGDVFCVRVGGRTVERCWCCNPRYEVCVQFHAVDRSARLLP